ncbi:MAG: PrpF domain-containing protein [Sporomusaceae bacterium]|nr:PrpF domain-containing protein [Sporomusaceae bacterium]
MAESEEDARKNKPNAPKIAMVAEPQDYVTTGGDVIKKAQVDILIKAVSMGKLHRTCPASCLYNVAAASLLSGTVPNQVDGFTPETKEQMVRIGHPEGVVEVLVTVADDGVSVSRVGMERQKNYER